jgi:hypothetical protein
MVSDHPKALYKVASLAQFKKRLDDPIPFNINSLAPC